MKKLLFLLTCCILGLPQTLLAQNTIHPTSADYTYPTEPKVAEKLEHWRDQKFGILIHWGIYAVPGIVESWSINNEPWIRRPDSTMRYEDYKRWYWDLSKQFNPRQFDPDQWAKAAARAGMKYLVFTTKHHDGFNMFDTQFSDYKITNGPFEDHPKTNVAKHVFEAFREQSMMIGAYFSKPDWHSQYYWWDYYATPDRNVNYDIRKHPWRWQQFVQFTHNQLQEITSNYGSIDILWLDGGWVRPLETVNEEVRSWGAPIPEFSQEINMPKVAEMARKNQEGILIVDRTVHGPFENYRTPEQGIPNTMSPDPWESCITLGGAWGYSPNDRFKSSRKVIHLLLEIVAKGGNLLLGVGPTPEGLFSQEQVSRLHEIGDWLDRYGEAIYHTRAIPDFSDGLFYFTKGKDQKQYALLPLQESESIQATYTWKNHPPKKGTNVFLIGENKPLKWKKTVEGTQIYLSGKQRKKLENTQALAFAYIPDTDSP